jgi:hypothetical protein
MKRPTFIEVPGLWEADGSLRDMYVLGTSVKDWKTFLEFASLFPQQYSFNGEAKEQPEMEQLFSSRDGSHLLSIKIGNATANCHFFMEGEIELDLNPKEIVGPSEHNQVLQFMEGVAERLGKPILLTPENGASVPHLSYAPASGVWHIFG